MKLTLSNIGKVKNSSIELNNLTILCGHNNTGKTYVTYTIYGLLKYWESLKFDLSSLRNKFNLLFKQQTIQISIDEIIDAILVKDFCKQYSETISVVLAAKKTLFSDSDIKIDNFKELVSFDSEFNYQGQLSNNDVINYVKKKQSKTIDITYTKKANKDTTHNVSDNHVDNYDVVRLEWQLKYILVISSLFSKIPHPFITSVERTGVAIFQADLVSDELLKKIAPLNENDEKRNMAVYPAPVQEDISTVHTVSKIKNNISELKNERPDILDFFTKIVSGNYKIDDTGTYYHPSDMNESLSLIESSSCIRSLLDLHIYLEYNAKKGQILIIDEPELNLHPFNQRKIACLIAMLVNYGIKVFITTHSDFIIKELGILLLLNNDKNKEYTESKGYQKTQILKPYMVNVYSSVLTNNTIELCKEHVSDEVGIELTSFDDSINEINELYDFLL